MKELFYYLDITAENCLVTGLLNGFPIYELNAPSPVNFAMPINSVLIGAGNQLAIALTPSSFDEPIDLINFDYQSMKATGAVKVYEQGDISAPENGKRILEIEVQGAPGAYTFDNEVIDCRDLLLKNPAIENDDEELEKYALFLRDLFSQEDVNAIQREFQPKLNDIARTFFVDISEKNVDFQMFLKNVFLPLDPVLDFGQYDLQLIPWCDERIWEIGVGLGKELLVTEADKEGFEYAIKVFVALVEGELKVVR